MHAYNPAQNEPEHVHAHLNPRRPVVAALPVLYARKEKGGSVNIYHDYQHTELVCTFGRDLSNKPRHNATSTIINGVKRQLFWFGN